MTLCTAAACLSRKNKPRIIVSSDWLAEVGTLAGAEVQNKLYWLFQGRWCVLIAGTVPAALSLRTTIRASIDPKKLTLKNIEDKLAKAVLKHRDKLVKRYVRNRHSVTYEYFRAHKAEFDEGQWTETQSAILGMELDCCLIVCTFLKGTPLIFQVNEDCSVVREENFAAIGTGSDVANAMLCYRQQHEELSIKETAYNLFEATKFARKAKVPGVGKLHAFSVLYPHRLQRRLRVRGLRQLKKYFKKYGPRRVKELDLPKGSWQQYE